MAYGLLKWRIHWATAWMWWTVGHLSFFVAPLAWCWGIPVVPCALPLHHFYMRRYFQGFTYLLTCGCCCLGNAIDALYMKQYLEVANHEVDEEEKDLEEGPPMEVAVKRHARSGTIAYFLYGATNLCSLLCCTCCCFPCFPVIPLHHMYLGRLWQSIVYMATHACCCLGNVMDGLFMSRYISDSNADFVVRMSVKEGLSTPNPAPLGRDLPKGMSGIGDEHDYNAPAYNWQPPQFVEGGPDDYDDGYDDDYVSVSEAASAVGTEDKSCSSGGP